MAAIIIQASIMLSAAALLAVCGISVYKGKIKLIHNYHWANVRSKDKPAYCKAMGKCLIAFAVPFVLSALLFMINTKIMQIVSTAELYIGITICVIAIIKVQKKYNGSVF